MIEDLVEASKVSTGNVKLNLESINICELIKQMIGEFEDRFKKKGLDIIINMPNEGIYVKADNRYMYRVIENLFSNISKYALENSRVYVDIYDNEGNLYADDFELTTEPIKNTWNVGKYYVYNIVLSHNNATFNTDIIENLP